MRAAFYTFSGATAAVAGLILTIGDEPIRGALWVLIGAVWVVASEVARKA